MRLALLIAIAAAPFCLSKPVLAQEPPAAPTVVATVNGEEIRSDAVDARQYDLIGKDTISKAVLGEADQLKRNPTIQQDLKSLLAAVVQEKPDASKEAIMAAVQERSTVYLQTVAVRRVKPTLFADVEKQAVDQLIDEALMLQEAKRQNVKVDEADVDRRIAEAPKRAGAEGEQLHKLLTAWDKRALPSVTARTRAALAWAAALKARFGAEADAKFDDVSARELAALKAKATISRK